MIIQTASIYKVILLSVFFISNSFCSGNYADKIYSEKDDIITEIWEKSDFKEYISFDLFKIAMTGYYEIELKKKDIITIIDYSKPSTEKRFYVIDLKKRKLLFRTFTAHGMNTGNNLAVHFSNKPNSKMSSLGYYITGETYKGKHGYSLKLDGIEAGINDNARKRAIVIHAADYVSKDFINKHGRLGRSWGCPALPHEIAKEIIDAISGGTCIFIFGDDDNYFKNSSFFRKKHQ